MTRFSNRRILATLFTSVVLAVVSTTPADGKTSGSHEVGSHEDHDSAPPDDTPRPEERERDAYGRDRGPASSAQLPHDLEGCGSHAATLRGGRTLREIYGLSEQVDEMRANRAGPGFRVTPVELERIDRASSVRDSIDAASLRDSLDDETLLGLVWDPASATMTAFVTLEPGQHLPDVDLPGSVEAVAVSSRLSARELRDAKSEVMGRVAESDRHGTIQASMDVTCGKTLIIVEDPRDLRHVQQLTRQFPGLFGVRVAPELAEQPADRYDHHHAQQDGGLGLRPYDEAGGAYLGNCTASIHLHRNGLEYAVTAGHCLRYLAVESTWLQWQCGARFVQGGIFISPSNNCVRYQMGGRVDAAVVAKYSYEVGQNRTMIHGGNHTYTWVGGWQSSRNNSSIGDQFCHSGRNWAGSPCGVLEATDHDVCFAASSNGRPAYCLNDVFTTSMPAAGGDSGATVWTTIGGINRYVGIVATNAGTITHIEDLRDNLGGLTHN